MEGHHQLHKNLKVSLAFMLLHLKKYIKNKNFCLCAGFPRPFCRSLYKQNKELERWLLALPLSLRGPEVSFQHSHRVAPALPSPGLHGYCTHAHTHAYILMHINEKMKHKITTTAHFTRSLCHLTLSPYKEQQVLHHSFSADWTPWYSNCQAARSLLRGSDTIICSHTAGRKLSHTLNEVGHLLHIWRIPSMVLHYIWRYHTKGFVKYPTATKNKILPIPDVSLSEHMRVKGWKAGEERM